MSAEQDDVEIMRAPEVVSVSGLPMSSLYYEMANNNFPKPINLSARRRGWIKAEVQAWVRARIAETRDPPKSKTRNSA
jgi:prophage regulatory protein